jgi:hypothetical protein
MRFEIETDRLSKWKGGRSRIGARVSNPFRMHVTGYIDFAMGANNR